MATLYEAQATAIGGRAGAAASADGALRLQLAMPEAIGGCGGEGTNPEQLFAAGYAACFLSAIRSVAAGCGVPIAVDANVTATVGLAARADAPGHALTVALSIDLPDLDEAEAQRIVREAHRVCPYSRALGDRTDVRLLVA